MPPRRDEVNPVAGDHTTDSHGTFAVTELQDLDDKIFGGLRLQALRFCWRIETAIASVDGASLKTNKTYQRRVYNGLVLEYVSLTLFQQTI